MPLYNWSCHVCTDNNPAGVEICTTCGFPASADGRQIELARLSRARGRQIRSEVVTDSRSPVLRAIDFVLASEVRIATLALAVAALVVVALSWGKYSNNEFVDGIRVEAHGMLLDILVIGIFILWLNLKRADSERIRRYAEEIDDFREWKSDEASYRIAGRIRRLNAAGKTYVFLSRCYLRKANLRDIKLSRAPMHQIDLGESNLRNATLTDVNLDTAFMGYSDMRGASIVRSNLTRARLFYAKADGVVFRGSVFRKAALNGARLRGADFQECNFEGCVFDGADLSGADFRNTKGLNVEALARANSLAYARFDLEISNALDSRCPELLIKNRRRTKFVPKPRAA